MAWNTYSVRHSLYSCLVSLIAATSIALSGCMASPEVRVPNDVAPQFGYVPFDPLPVSVNRTGLNPPDASAKYDPVLTLLPDETVRIAVAKFDSKLGITYGVAKADADAGSYRVTLDYMKFTTANFKLFRYDDQGPPSGRYRLYNEATDNPSPPVIVPVYVGCGLRIVAEVTIYGGSVNLGSLFALGAAAEARQLRGTLMVQSLGIGGPAVSGALPMPSEINQTTIANAITALATIKSKLYDEGTRVSPRVLGIYNTIGGDANTVNGIIGMLLTHPPELPLAGGSTFSILTNLSPEDLRRINQWKERIQNQQDKREGPPQDKPKPPEETPRPNPDGSFNA